MAWTPALELSEAGDRCRLSAAGRTARGRRSSRPPTSCVRLLDVALRFRRPASASRARSGPNMDELSFVWELGEIAAGGGDIRPRVFGLD